MLTIFDCDGVLVDSEVVALDTLVAMMADYGHPMNVAECAAAFLGRQNADIVRGIEARLGRALPPDTGARMRERMLETLKRELKPVPGAADALALIDGPRCVASSSDPARIALTLRLTRLDGFFTNLFSGAEVARGKPAPDLFLHAAARMGFAPGDCVVIEDSVFGVEAGVAAGMLVVGFTGGGHTDAEHAGRLRAAGAGVICPHMRELPGMLADASA